MMRFLVHIICLLGIANMLNSQVVMMTFDKDTLTVGELVSLKVRIDGDTKTEYQLDYSNIDSLVVRNLANSSDGKFILADFKILDYGQLKEDSREVVIPQLPFETTIKLKIFDFGLVVMPFFSLKKDSIIVKEGNMTGVYIEVPEVISNAQDSMQIAPIKPIIEEPKNWTDYKGIIFSLIGLLVLMAAWFVWKRYFQNREANIAEEKEEVIELPAHEIALLKLDALEKEKPWLQGKVIQYHSDLTYAIREYLENRYGIPALESTTSEIKSALDRHSEFPRQYVPEVLHILQIADMIKFAKAKTQDDMNAEFLEQAKTLVNDTKLEVTNTGE